jgi:predicted nucleotidyltransferase
MLTSQFITHRLYHLAAERGIDLLYAVESGSRAWGLGSTDSDYDVRFVYRHPREWYLSLHPGDDQIGPIMEQGGELDLAGWDIRKYLHHLSNSNPSVVEWLSSPIVYFDDAAFAAGARPVADRCFRPRRAIAHYLGIAKGARVKGLGHDGQWNLKKFTYWMRAILAAESIARFRRRNPITVSELLAGLNGPVPKDELRYLIDRKSQVPESFRTTIDPAVIGYLDTLRDYAERTREELPQEVGKHPAADAFFRAQIGYP